MWPAVVKGEITRAPNSGAVAEVIERLDISGVVAAAFVERNLERNNDGGAGPQSFVGLYFVDDLLHEALEPIEFGRRWACIQPALGLYEGHGRQRAVLDRRIAFGGVADVRATGGAGDYRRGVLERLPDVAVGLVRSDEVAVRLGEIGVRLAAIIGPGVAVVAPLCYPGL